MNRSFMNCRMFITFPLVLALSGCAWLAPKYQRPALELPEKKPASESREVMTQKRLIGWWQEYNDSVLQQLIDCAMVRNDDLALATARLQQARAVYDYTFSNRFPLLAVTGSSSHTELDFKNKDILVGKSLPPAIGSMIKPGDLFPERVDISSIGGMLSYEVDLWGKLASANKAAKAAYLAASHNQDAVRLAVASATAQLYFSILALDADIKITSDTIASRQEAYNLYKFQYDHEAVSGLVLRQSEAELNATQGQLPKLLNEKDKAESSLAVLLGYSPREIMEAGIPRGRELDALPVPPLQPDDLPSMLLETRPDIAAAEQALIASNFDIGVARAAYFPTISLSSLCGISSVDIQNIYDGPIRTWQLGTSMAGPLIDFGRTASGVELAKARNQEHLATYKNTVRTAFKEIKDALSAQAYSRDEEQAQTNEERALSEALRLANERYSAGYSSYIEVLDAQRNLYSTQISLVAAKLSRLNASANLYKALGGGWKQEPLTSQSATTPRMNLAPVW